MEKLTAGGVWRANTTPAYLTNFVQSKVNLPAKDLDFPEQVCYTSPEE